MRPFSWRKVAARQINWQHQLRNGPGGSDEDANNDNDADMMTMTTTTSMAGSIRIIAGMDTAAVLRQGLTMQGKCS